MKSLIVGDLHLRERLPYADYIKDGRKSEKKKILDFIHSLSKDCDRVIFLGDQLNGRNNHSEVIKEFVQYLERFDQEVFMIAGNHEKTGDGKSAIDFLKEVKNKKWHIITNEVVKIGPDVFCPYFYKGELGAENHKLGTATLLPMLPPGENLFIHHAISGYNFKNIDTDSLNEIVLPKDELSKNYEKIFCGHIHLPSDNSDDKIVYAGSIFGSEVNEGEKFVYTVEDGKVKRHALPGRKIVRLDNPTIPDFEAFDEKTIMKAILTEKPGDELLEEIKNKLASFDGSILVEDYKTERKIIKFVDGELDLNIMNLMRVYAEEKKIDFDKLQAGYDLIK